MRPFSPPGSAPGTTSSGRRSCSIRASSMAGPTHPVKRRFGVFSPQRHAPIAGSRPRRRRHRQATETSQSRGSKGRGSQSTPTYGRCYRRLLVRDEAVPAPSSGTPCPRRDSSCQEGPILLPIVVKMFSMPTTRATRRTAARLSSSPPGWTRRWWRARTSEPRRPTRSRSAEVPAGAPPLPRRARNGGETVMSGSVPRAGVDGLRGRTRMTLAERV